MCYLCNSSAASGSLQLSSGSGQTGAWSGPLILESATIYTPGTPVFDYLTTLALQYSSEAGGGFASLLASYVSAYGIEVVADYGNEIDGLVLNLGLGIGVTGSGALERLGSAKIAVGGSGDDFIVGTDLPARAETNLLFGGDGNDSIWGLDGNDTLVGGAGDDILVGGADNDLLFGGSGSDWLYGGDGEDQLHGGGAPAGGYDVLNGGAGNDTLEGSSAGFDYLIGGSGNDLFVVRGGGGIRVIDDFAAGGDEDSVALLGTGLQSFADVQARLSFSEVINGTVLVVDDETQIWFVNGVQPAALTADDFQFT